MLRFTARALAACASIAAITLLASTASAELPRQLLLQSVRPTANDFGPNIEAPEEPQLGTAVVIRDELGFIGMPARSPAGRVGVYSSTATSLVRTGTLTPGNPTANERFGRTLAYRDGILVVGANKAAYVFQRNNGVWTQRQKLTPPAADNVLTFADSLRYEDGTLAIGANSRAFDRPGAVYIYQRDTTGKFIARGKLVSPHSSPADGFGIAISTAGPVMVIGEPGAEAAHIYRRNSAGVWLRNQTLVASDLGTGPGEGGGFGSAVAIDRQMIIVGAPFALDEQFDFRGAAYGFTPGGGIYVETFKLDARAGEFNDNHVFFGRQIAMFDQRIVIGAQRVLSSDSQLNGFVAFVYTRSGTTVTPRSIVVQHLASTSLSLANYRLLVGFPCDASAPAGFCPGRANLFNLNVFE